MSPREAAPHAKAHRAYHNAAGVRVPSVTTILGMLNKPYLMKWANNLGLDGYDSTEYVRAQAQVGTLSHALIQAELTGESFAVTGFSSDEQDRAAFVIRSFRSWRKSHDLAPILMEEGFVSEANRFGGTVDLYAMLDGVPTVIDYKSSNDIYDEHKTQVSTYRHLMMECGHDVARAMILRLPRSDDDSHFEWSSGSTERRYDFFLALRDAYELQRAVEAEEKNDIPVERKPRKQIETARLVPSGRKALVVDVGRAAFPPVAMTTERKADA